MPEEWWNIGADEYDYVSFLGATWGRTTKLIGSRVSYIWLVAYSAIMRKRTRMPFVPSQQRLLVAHVRQQQQQQDPGLASDAAAGPAAVTAPQRVMSGVPEFPGEPWRSTPVYPVARQSSHVSHVAPAHAGTAVWGQSGQ